MRINPITKEKHPVAYFSQKVPEAKKHLAAFDQELNAITNACQFFREYILGLEFMIYTDHMSLTYQANVKNLSPRIARIISKLGEFTFKIKHIRGKVNHLADYLSRKDVEGESCELKYGKLMYNKGKKVQIVTRGQSKKKEEKDSGVKFIEKQ